MTSQDQAWVPVHDRLFATDADGSIRLLGAHCHGCGEHHFPARAVCPWCSSEDVVEARLSNLGTLWAWTAVTATPPGYLGEVPFGFGVVELPEGLRVVTRLTDADPGALVEGQAMRLVEVALHVDEEGRTVSTYAFGQDPSAA